MPVVREAIEGRRWKEADAGAAALGQALEQQAALLAQAAEVLSP